MSAVGVYVRLGREWWVVGRGRHAEIESLPQRRAALHHAMGFACHHRHAEGHLRYDAVVARVLFFMTRFFKSVFILFVV